MAKTRVQKEESVQYLTDKLQRAQSVVFTDYKGLTMLQLSDLRRQLREDSAEIAVTKNTLLKRALAATTYPQIPDLLLTGPIATMFAYADEISPIKSVVKSLKDFQKGEVKGGFLDGQFLDKYRVVTLSNLPSKVELQGQVVGVLVAPLTGVVGVLQANLRNLVYAFEQIRLQKGGDQQASS